MTVLQLRSLCLCYRKKTQQNKATATVLNAPFDLRLQYLRPCLPQTLSSLRKTKKMGLNALFKAVTVFKVIMCRDYVFDT